MTGYGDTWGSWTTQSSLQLEWSEFEALCSECKDRSDFSKRCQKLLGLTLEDAAERMDEHGAEEIQYQDNAENAVAFRSTQEEYFSQASQPTQNDIGMMLPSQGLEDHNVDSLVLELNEVLESESIPLPDDLISDLSELSPPANCQLLKQLREQLTNNGLHTLCQLAIESMQESLERNTWLHPALICKYIILPKVASESECSNEVCVVLEEFARSCPEIVILHILHPILANEQIQLDLVQRVTSALPTQHHLKLIKHVLKGCQSPLPVPKIAVLTTLLEAVSVDLNQIFKKLMPLLEKSADSLATNEQFAKLLLVLVPRLPSNTTQSVRQTLANIARQNKSFKKQLLLNALKERE